MKYPDNAVSGCRHRRRYVMFSDSGGVKGRCQTGPGPNKTDPLSQTWGPLRPSQHKWKAEIMEDAFEEAL